MVVLYWIADAAGYRLVSATNLSPPINWTNVTSARVTMGNQVYTTNSIAGASPFYELIFP